MNARGTSRPVFSFALVPRRVPRQSHRLEFTCAHARVSKNLSLSFSLSLSLFVSPPSTRINQPTERKTDGQKESRGKNAETREPPFKTISTGFFERRKEREFSPKFSRPFFFFFSFPFAASTSNASRTLFVVSGKRGPRVYHARDRHGPLPITPLLACYARVPTERHDVLCVCTVQCLLGANLVIERIFEKKHALETSRGDLSGLITV